MPVTGSDLYHCFIGYLVGVGRWFRDNEVTQCRAVLEYSHLDAGGGSIPASAKTAAGLEISCSLNSGSLHARATILADVSRLDCSFILLLVSEFSGVQSLMRG